MRHKFFIQQFDLSYLEVSRFDYVCYLRKSREYSTLKHEVCYNFIPGIPVLFIEPTVQHLLSIKHSWL